MPCLWFSVERAAHSKMKPGQSHKARSRGQINRYKANDLADSQQFLGAYFLLVLMINKNDKTMALVMQVHGQIEIN